MLMTSLLLLYPAKNVGGPRPTRPTRPLPPWFMLLDGFESHQQDEVGKSGRGWGELYFITDRLVYRIRQSRDYRLDSKSFMSF